MTVAEVQAYILRDAMINILSDPRDLEHAQGIASEALCDIEEDDGVDRRADCPHGGEGVL
jgi:hypothetical protein